MSYECELEMGNENSSPDVCHQLIFSSNTDFVTSFERFFWCSFLNECSNNQKILPFRLAFPEIFFLIFHFMGFYI